MSDPRPPDERFGPPESNERFESPTPLGPEPPHWSLWLFYLVFAPRVFFETYVLRSIPVLTAFAAWMYGVAAAFDEIESRTLLSSRDNPLFDLLRSDWAAIWGFALVIGALGGVFYLAIGGWWYRVRLGWCGAQEPDAGLARRVFVFSAQAYVVPYLLYIAWETSVYASPAAAAMGDDWGGLLVIAALFWSIYVSYRGARTAFPLRAWPARTWFGILPALLYAITLGGLWALFSTGIADTPNLDRTLRIERDGFSLSYPGNWEVDVADEDYDPDAAFGIGPPFADAAIQFWFYAEPADSRECVNVTLEQLSSVFELGDRTEIDRWAGFEGAGYRLDDAEYHFVLFCSTERSQPFEILLVAPTDLLELLQPGFDLIRDSFELRPVPDP